MQLPQGLGTILDTNHRWMATVHGAISRFEPLIRGASPPFFPEYTDHGPSHNEDVLQTSFGLVTEGALEILSVTDAAILTLSVLLHDCAMHLTEDGFASLVTNGDRWPGCRDFGDESWSDLWNDFYAEARRFDGRTLRSIFGDPTPVRYPPLTPSEMTLRDRMLIGEFLRRHHPRLAHDVALHGFPGPDGTTSLLLGDLAPEMADLAGITARSHGQPLRDCLPNLSRYHLRDFQGVHVVFLTVLLRIADYLQVQPQRAPKELLTIRRLSSPVSQGEWKLHSSVSNITTSHDDPEALDIRFQPKDVRTFIRAKEWTRGLQSEMDTSWAVLGEVYGRFPPLRNFGLKLRRARSNLDDDIAFASTVAYVPAKLHFDSAGGELLLLLVEPLYGGQLELGIRELIQNAVDAVRELVILRERHLTNYQTDSTNGDAPDVVVEVEFEGDDPIAVTVTDTGIGMNLDVMRDYFLKAGATFRKSAAWRREFEDEEGHSRVIRSGRFGIGASAAFLRARPESLA